jgi:hypothetical protein
MGLAYLSGSYQPPVLQTFVRLCREHFKEVMKELEKRQQKHRRASVKTAGKSKKAGAKHR